MSVYDILCIMRGIALPLGYQDYFHNFGDLNFYIFISNNCLIIKVSFEIKKIYKIMKNNLDTPVAKQCRALYTKYAYGHTYGLLKVGLR